MSTQQCHHPEHTQARSRHPPRFRVTQGHQPATGEAERDQRGQVRKKGVAVKDASAMHWPMDWSAP